MSRKAVLWPVIISVIIHLTLLTVAGMIDLHETINPVDVLSVSISEPEPENNPLPKKENKTREKTKSVKTVKNKGFDVPDDHWREDTIDLGSTDIKYVTYLAKVKKKILGLWKYPQKAYARNEEGDVVVRMSIDANGTLAGVKLLSSSGSVDLDDGSLIVIQQAAPYEPLPEVYNLSRLHIIASFNYKIMD